MFACRRTFTIAQRQFHTAPIICAKSEGGLFDKLNPWAKKETTQPQETTPAQHTSEEPHKVTFNVRYEEPENIVSWKRNDILKDQNEIESTVKSVILQNVNGATEANWKELGLEDLNTKFQVIKESMKQTGKEVPNYELNKMSNTKDILEYFKSDRPLNQSSANVQEYFEQNRESLPSNIKFVPK
ncbi:MAG: hypothetical protein EXX96DRAFT_55040 [Benjaminiella poitrasii]|nr:MAG: hypothetical protein EXX96DRAFT_55040 [Benjaminiella poitrasii]